MAQRTNPISSQMAAWCSDFAQLASAAQNDLLSNDDLVNVFRQCLITVQSRSHFLSASRERGRIGKDTGCSSPADDV